MERREIDHYQRLAREFRGTPGQIGAGSRQSQEVRFRVIVELLEGLLGKRWTRMRLLDFGCGKGDLAPFLQRHTDFDPVSSYIGLDAIPENIEDARKLGDFDVRLGIWDGRGQIVEEEIDLTVFSGALNTSRIGRRKRMFRRMLEMSRVGVVGNFLTFDPGVKDYGPDNILLDPETCLKWIDREKFRVRLRLDYLPHDFSVAAVRWDKGRSQESGRRGREGLRD
ncbi:MAG: methyltransferase domain-containing protein [Acidobacteriota bacterium]